MSRFNQKGLTPLILIVLALVGLVIGVWLVQNRTNFLPNAQMAVPNLTKQTAFHLFLSSNFFVTQDGSNVAMSQDSGGGGSSDSISIQPENGSSATSSRIVPTRTWFYPGEEFKVNLAVSSDIDSANTFSAIINFPPDLLEVTSITKESNQISLKHPKMESVLIEIINSSNREEFAKTRGLEYKAGKVKVTLELYKTVDAIAINFKDYGFEETARYETLVEGSIPVDSLLKFADLSNIKYIRTPMRAFPADTLTEAVNSNIRNGSASVGSSESGSGTLTIPGRKSCPAVATRACIFDTVMCIKAPCPPQQRCEDFPSQCDVPPGWDIVEDGGGYPKDCNPSQGNIECKKGYYCKPNSSCNSDNTACTDVGGGTCVIATRPVPTMPPVPNPSPINCSMVDCAPRAVTEGCYFVGDGSCCGGNIVCEPSPSTQDYFIRFWLPDTGFDNNTGKITLSGGVSGGGILTVPPSKPIMATITFRAKKAGDANIYVADESVILRNSDSANILTNKNKLMVQVQEKPATPVVKGDLDGDGIVGFVDFSILLTNWGTDSKKADITGDGKVDIFDFSMMLTNWSGRKGVKPLQVCPQEWIQNMMPGIANENSSGATPREYLIYEGKRRETSEFDMDWVKRNCNIQPQPVY